METNINAAKALLEEYKAITIDLIKEVYNEIGCEFFNDGKDKGQEVMQYITGFGGSVSCKLCKTAREIVKKQQNRITPPTNLVCDVCVYKSVQKPEDDAFFCVEDTYEKLEFAETPEEIFEALQERIKFLEDAISRASQESNIQCSDSE